MSLTQLSWPRRACQQGPTGARGASSLFPLPLTPFELYMLLDDGPAHPMQFCCRLRCQGQLERPFLQQAVDQALARHPLLTASVDRAGDKQYEWVPQTPLPIQWQIHGDATQLLEPAVIDIRSQPGLHLACQISDRTSNLRFTFHHAACDGLAAMDFIVDVLVGYANLVEGKDRFGLKPLDPDGVLQRGRNGFSSWQWRLWCLRNAGRLPSAYRFYKRRPQPLFPHPLDRSQPLTAPSVRLHHFDVRDSRQLRLTAQQAGTAVNTLLIRDLLLSCQRLREARNLARPDDWLRITMPLSMRGPGDRRTSAANLVSLGFVDYASSDLQDRDELLRGLDAKLRQLVAGRRGLAFLTGLAILQRYPQTLAESLQRNRCFSTILFSNFGAALPGCCLPRSHGRLVAGNLVVEQIEFIPVLRPLQLANFALTHYAGRYVLGMRYDSRHLTLADADDVLQGYLTQIRESIGSAA